MYRFTISPVETVPQFNDNLRIQFNEGNVYQEIKTVKTFEFENTRSNAKKMLRLLKKNENQIYQSGAFIYKCYP